MTSFLERFKGQISSVNKRGEIDCSNAKPVKVRAVSAASKQRTSPPAVEAWTPPRVQGDFQPYTLKEYAAIKEAPQQLGGLGPSHLGTEEWSRRKAQQERKQDYARVVQLKNKSLPKAPPRTAQQPTRPSARDRALEFSKRIPKPVAVRHSPPSDSLQPEPAATALDELEAKHEAYQKAIAQLRSQMFS